MAARRDRQHGDPAREGARRDRGLHRGHPEKMERCRELGADLAISYRDDDFVAAVKEFTGGRGADVILDIIGAPYLERTWTRWPPAAAWCRSSARQGGSRAEINLGTLMYKRVSITPRRCGPAPWRRRPRRHRRQGPVWPLVAAGQVAAVIERTLPLPRRRRRTGHGGQRHVGKILLVPSEPRRLSGADCVTGGRTRGMSEEMNPEAQEPQLLVVGPDGVATAGRRTREKPPASGR